jgi:hypothetical protein
MTNRDDDASKLIKGIATSPSVEQLLSSRGTPLGSAVLGTHDKRCMHTLSVISNPEAWAAFPSTCRTLSFSNLLFKRISRAGASVHYLLILPHSQFPYLLFLWILDPSKKELILNKCRGSMDQFTNAFLSRFRHDVSNKDADFELLMILLLTKTATIRIEALNSLLQRILRTK